MPLRSRTGAPRKSVVKTRGADVYISFHATSATKYGGALGKGPKKLTVARVGKPGRYVVEKRSGRLYVTEIGGSSGKKVLFRVHGKKAKVSAKAGLDKKLTKAFASAVKSAL